MSMLATLQYPWCGGHMAWGGGFLMMFAWLVALIAIGWFGWAMMRRGGISRGDRAETLLRERYARGDIDEATYRRMLEELRRV